MAAACDAAQSAVALANYAHRSARQLLHALRSCARTIHRHTRRAVLLPIRVWCRPPRANRRGHQVNHNVAALERASPNSK